MTTPLSKIQHAAAFGCSMLLLLLICEIGVPLIGLAASVYLFSFPQRRFTFHFGLAVGVLLLLPVIAWGALFVACLLVAMLFAQTWQSSTLAMRMAQLLASILCMKAILFIILPQMVNHLEVHESVLWVSALLAVVASSAFWWSQESDNMRIDIVLTAILTLLLMVIMLTIALLSIDMDYASVLVYTALASLTLTVLLVLLLSPLIAKTSMGEQTILGAVELAFSFDVPVAPWIKKMSELAQLDANAQELTEHAMQEFLTVPAVVGVRWSETGGEEHCIGDVDGQLKLSFQLMAFRITLYVSRRQPIMAWFNYYLLARIVSEFVVTKQREEKNRIDDMSRAIHQTGARLVHDIKNILHTLVALTHTNNPQTLQKHLPILRLRLENTLAKLKQPDTAIDNSSVPIAEWWESAKQRYQHYGLNFIEPENALSVLGELGEAAEVSCSQQLFDLALDNFVGNAMIKRQSEPDIEIQISLKLTESDERGAVLQVKDNGSAVPADKKDQLFKQPVDSESGFGIGLYQVAEEAQKYNHVARLNANQDGEVEFILSPQLQLD